MRRSPVSAGFPDGDQPMPAKNIYHDVVIHALTDEGWTITHDPLTISYGGKDLFVDLGAERSTIAAEEAGQRIAVEIQSLLCPSPSVISRSGGTV